MAKNIPQIERGNELLWHETSVASMILTNLRDLYPDLYEQLKEQLKGTLKINRSHKEVRDKLDKMSNVQKRMNLFQLLHRC